MKQRIAMLLVILAFAIIPHALLSIPPVKAATICTMPKTCSTLDVTIRRVWSEGTDPYTHQVKDYQLLRGAVGRYLAAFYDD